MRRRALRRRGQSGLAGGLLLLMASGCGGVSELDAGSGAQVRYVQVAPNVADADFFVNGVGTAYGLEFESFTSYLPLVAGPATMAAHHAGRSRAFLSSDLNLAPGHRYTLILSENAGVALQRLIPDEEPMPAVGSVAVRLVNEVQGVSGLTFHLAEAGGGSLIGAGPGLQVAQGGVSAYVNVPASSPIVVAAVLPGAGLALPLASVTVKASAGAVRTVVFAGAAHREGHSRVVAFSLPDADPPG